MGHAWRGASDAAVRFIPCLVRDTGNLAADIWDYARGATQPVSVLAPDSRSYRMRTPLMQAFVDQGLGPAVGHLVTESVRGMPGISLIDQLGQPSRSWQAVGAATLNTAAGTGAARWLPSASLGGRVLSQWRNAQQPFNTLKALADWRPCLPAPGSICIKNVLIACPYSLLATIFEVIGWPCDGSGNHAGITCKGTVRDTACGAACL